MENETEKNWNLYVLQLEHGKYYVGITTQTPKQRFQQHLKGGFMSAKWAKRYKPVAIMEQQNLGITTKHDAEIVENKKTRELMRQYGYNNVRGGDLSYQYRYVRRFGWLFIDKEWKIITTLVLLLAIIFMFGLLYFLKK
jgi:predicted GIY-YIG superfamily endonuclease